MCLTVTHVPSGPEDFLVMPCYKVLFKDGPNFHTPYQNARVPRNGWLLPKKSYLEMRYWGEYTNQFFSQQYEDHLHRYYDVHGGAIHAYLEYNSMYPPERMFNAYAINVLAFEQSDKVFGIPGTLICTALYVPSLDKTKAQEATEDQLAYWSKYQTTIEELKEFVPKKVHPLLRRPQ